MRRTPAAIATLAATAVIALAGCQSGNSGAKAAAASATANPTVQAELKQGQLLLASCFPAQLTGRIKIVHLVFLSSAHGKNGPAVTAARDKVFGCLGIDDPVKRQAFVNKAGEDFLHGHLNTHDGRVKYFEITLPQDILAAGGHAQGMGTSTAQPSIPGTTAQPSPAPSTFTPTVTGSTS